MVNGAGDIGEYLLKLVNDKTVLRPPSPVPAPAPSNAGSAITNGVETERPTGEQIESENSQGPPEKDVVAETGTMA